MERKKLLNIAENDDDKMTVSRLIDVFSTSDSKNIIRNSQFLNGHQIVLAKKVAAGFSLSYGFYGGYDEAERCILVCYPDFLYPENEDIPIKIIKAETKNHSRLSHRDYMGAVLNLGIKREKIGDIVVCDDCAYIMCMDDIADYIMSQIEKIGNCGVRLSVSSFDNVSVPPKKFKEITSSCSSIRLDAVVAAGTGLSRTEASNLVTKGLVSVNWEVRDKNDFRPDEGDVISIHGHGRILFYQIGGNSKKGRTFITLRKYI